MILKMPLVDPTTSWAHSDAVVADIIICCRGFNAILVQAAIGCNNSEASFIARN